MLARPRRWLALAVILGCGNDVGIGGDDPGRVTLHRLNNTEYNNTVRDLLGTALRPADDFPSDDRGFGFDNVADSLSLSPLQVELYELAATALIEDAFQTAIPTTRTKTEIEAVGGTSGRANGEGWNFSSNGSATVPFEITHPGTYRIAIRAAEMHAGTEYARMTLRVSGGALHSIDVSAPIASPAVYTTELTLPAGSHTAVVAFANDAVIDNRDRNLWVDYVEVIGPFGATIADTSKRDRIVICDPASGRACVEQILRTFVRRAWRRTPTADELARLVKLVDLAGEAGDDVTTGLKLALRGALVSPSFLFRIELDPEPRSLAPHPVSGVELASRLSYFLWSTMPDDALLDAAETGKLATTDEVRAQIDRMLADPRAAALTDNFAGQWLFTRALGDHVPDAATFPTYDAQLEAAMRAETQRYFRAFLEDDLPMDQFLVGDFTFVNDRLAAHYGLPVPGTSELVRVSLAGTERRGLLTQGSILTVTSHPLRTSPVKRGKWLLDQLLCAPPAAPPPGVEGLLDDVVPGGEQLTIREQLAQHRENEYCASCHDHIDPLGLGLDHFDGIGAYRTQEAGGAIDAAGVLPDGRQFYGASELAEILAADPVTYRCMVEKLYTYALGSPPNTRAAASHIDELTAEFTSRGYVLRDLVKAIVTHDAFRNRRGEP